MQTSKRPRPCGNCRQRKRRCVVEPGQTVCELCRLYSTDGCTFDGPPPRRPAKQQKTNSSITLGDAPARAEPRYTTSQRPEPTEQSIHTLDVIEDYDDLHGPSLLKNNLGLLQHQFSRYNGPSGPWTPFHLQYCQFDGRDEFAFPSGLSIRRVSADASFSLKRSSVSSRRMDRVFVHLYFRIIHPSFPVLDKGVFLEKYERTHREFSPACLGGVYLLALDWWEWDPFLSVQERPNMDLLEAYVCKGLHDVISRPKLSVLQGGMLLLQHRPYSDDAWALSAQLVATMQELGVHIDCDSWRIPAWEKSLRKRLAWSVYVVDKWMALIHGRPSHIVEELDWAVEPLTEDDFPETPTGEDQEDGSGEVEAGRLSFQMLISLSEIVNEILRGFYSARAMKTNRKVRNVLQVAKPIQIKLREWRRNLPTCLNLECAKARRKSPIGSLHLAYYAVEISLHKAILLGLQGSSCDPAIVSVCREAARERAVASIEFVKGLTPEQIQSFWHFSSAMNLVYIGVFTALLYLTSQRIEETQSYKKHLEEYRWTLRVMSRAASFVSFAVRRLDMSLLHLDHLSVHDIVRNNRQNAVLEQPPSTSTARLTSSFEVNLNRWRSSTPGSASASITTPADARFEHQRSMAILNAVDTESLLLDQQQQISPVDMGDGGWLDFYEYDWNDLNPSEV
ncbi:fungal-specific transcription factor domain-containing protein [Aspergillus multicolor]|uniref:transcription factor domain-containing protein n=1 Tax=Aspergillus multicolor TaxID=41759 RepID=UPI003CCE12CB